MPYVIRQIHPPGKSARADEATAVALLDALMQGGPDRGDFLEWSDPDANHGFGDDGWTPDLAKAKKFESFAAAAACWNAQSKVRPIRSDGKPNKPLTAYSVTIETVP
jgi:hypothetical protein